MKKLMSSREWRERRESQLRQERSMMAAFKDAALWTLSFGRKDRLRDQASKEADNATQREIMGLLDALTRIDPDLAAAGAISTTQAAMQFEEALDAAEFEFIAVSVLADLCKFVAERGPEPKLLGLAPDSFSQTVQTMCRESVRERDNPHPFRVTDNYAGVIADSLNYLISQRAVPWLARIEARALANEIAKETGLGAPTGPAARL